MLRGLTTQRIAAISKYVGPLYGDIYATAADIYPSFRTLRETPMFFLQDDIFAGGRNADGELALYLGRGSGAVTPRIQSRLIERFKLPPAIADLPDSHLALRPFIFAHELGHIVQADVEFPKYFGEIDRRVIDDKTDYAGYVRSDNEANADFIAATIIGNSDFGMAVASEVPAEGPSAWRQWSALHPVEQTIAKFATASEIA